MCVAFWITERWPMAASIVMERLDGEDLDHLVRNHGALSMSDAVEMILQARDALAEAHRRGMVNLPGEGATHYANHPAITAVELRIVERKLRWDVRFLKGVVTYDRDGVFIEKR